MAYAVYVHEFPNGKKYIGISGNVARRFRKGQGYRKQKIVYTAIQKYGWDSVKTTILFDGLTEKEAKAKEIELIAQHKTADRKYGYNQTLGGEGASGRPVSEENRRKIGEMMRKVHKGVSLSEEHRQNISKSLKGKAKNYSEEGRKRLISSNKTREHSEETRRKMSKNTKAAMEAKGMGEYLSAKWNEDKERRKAMLRVAMYDRYGVVPKKYDLRTDVILLGYDKNDYAELFCEEGKNETNL